jgi:pimeloyl-ACP methyl ester carboxylesterase
MPQKRCTSIPFLLLSPLIVYLNRFGEQVATGYNANPACQLARRHKMIRALLRVVVPVVCLATSASAQDVKRIAVIAGSSHTVPAEKPEAVDEAVLTCFGKH